MTIEINIAVNGGSAGMKADLTDIGQKEEEGFHIYLSQEELNELEKFGENRIKETAALLLMKSLWTLQARFFQLAQEKK